MPLRVTCSIYIHLIPCFPHAYNPPVPPVTCMHIILASCPHFPHPHNPAALSFPPPNPLSNPILSAHLCQSHFARMPAQPYPPPLSAEDNPAAPPFLRLTLLSYGQASPG